MLMIAAIVQMLDVFIERFLPALHGLRYIPAAHHGELRHPRVSLFAILADESRRGRLFGSGGVDARHQRHGRPA
jgi:hypothetical protein